MDKKPLSVRRAIKHQREIQREIQERTKRMKENPDKVLVAEGDSWFSYLGTNVIAALEDNHSYDVEEVADRGDTLEEMAYDKNQINELIKCLEQLKDDKIRPGAILLSGGGNDFVSALPAILNYNQPNCEDHSVLNEKIMNQVIDNRFKNAYKTLIDCITKKSKQVFNTDIPIPILIHGYDYFVPNGREVDFDGLIGEMGEVVVRAWRHFKEGKPWYGPWLKPVFEKKGYNDLTQNTDTIKKVVDRFNKMLFNLKEEFNHVHYVDVRGCLTEKDWSDEIHPTEKGFEKAAGKFEKKIKHIDDH